jgi:tetratricopeptide (TPR) repeat protein
LDKKAPGLFPGEVYYRIGKTQYRLNDHSIALESLQKALAEPQGERETAPLSSFLIAKIYDQRGNPSAALEHYRQVLEYGGPQKVLRNELKEARKRIKKLQPQ